MFRKGLNLLFCILLKLFCLLAKQSQFAVDALLDLGKLQRVLAQVEVSFSNSMIESWWRSLKSNWIYINQLDSFAALERLISFYVSEHNTKMPHAAFHGQTPDEVYFNRRPANRRPRLEARAKWPRGSPWR